MDKEEISNKIKDGFKKIAKASKSAFEITGEKVQKFSDETVEKVKLNKIETQRSCKYEELGMKVSQMLYDGAGFTSADEEDVKVVNSILEEIKLLSQKISEKEADLDLS